MVLLTPRSLGSEDRILDAIEPRDPDHIAVVGRDLAGCSLFGRGEPDLSAVRVDVQLAIGVVVGLGDELSDDPVIGTDPIRSQRDCEAGHLVLGFRSDGLLAFFRQVGLLAGAVVREVGRRVRSASCEQRQCEHQQNRSQFLEHLSPSGCSIAPP